MVSLLTQTLGSSAEHLAKAAYLLFENCYTPVAAGIRVSLWCL